MTDHQMANGSKRLEQKIDVLTDTVRKMDTRLGRVEEELGGVKVEVAGLKQEIGGMKQEIGELGTQVTKVYFLAEKTERFTKDAWDSLESLRANVVNGFEEAKKDNGREFQLVRSAIRDLGVKVQQIEEAPARARNREL